MYFVRPSGNLLYKIDEALKQYFGDKAEIRGWCDGKLYVKIDENAGYKDEEKYLTKEEIDNGVIGGGLTQGMDGKTFCIEVSEIHDFPWMMK